MSHTPGPWFFDPEVEPEDPKKARLEIVDESFNGVIATVTNSEDEISEDYANGRLLAAAPELLEALKGLLNECDLGEATDETQLLIDVAKAAISKATGVPK